MPVSRRPRGRFSPAYASPPHNPSSPDPRLPTSDSRPQTPDPRLPPLSDEPSPVAVRGFRPVQPNTEPSGTDFLRRSAAEVIDLPGLPAVECPCGSARRAFAGRDEFPGTVHLTEISRDAVRHYHREHTEVYVVLDCDPEAAIELDGERHPVRPRTSVLIPPGVRHRACGRMTVLIVCSPNFDPDDEHFD